MPAPNNTTSTSPWLSHEQQRVWRSYLRATHALNEFLDRELRPFGLSLSEYEILVNLSESENSQMRMSDLADASHQSRSRLTHTITRMEKSGLVAREACPSDRRGVWARLTPAGHDLLRSAAPSHVESVRTGLVDAVDPADYEALGRVCAAILHATEADTSPATDLAS